MLLNWRIWAAIGLAVAFALSNAFTWRASRAVVKAEWQAEKLEYARAQRAKETALQAKTQEVDRALQVEKKRRAVADRAATDALGMLDAALSTASTDTPTACGTDADPRPLIASECSAALVELDKANRGLAGTLAALQGWAKSVCLAP